MTQLRSFLLLSNIPLYICTTSSLSITFSYVFSWRWHLKWEFEPLGWFTQFAWISPIYSCYSTLFYFLLLSYSMSISFLGQPKDPRSIQQNPSSPTRLPGHCPQLCGDEMTLTPACPGWPGTSEGVSSRQQPHLEPHLSVPGSLISQPSLRCQSPVSFPSLPSHWKF